MSSFVTVAPTSATGAAYNANAPTVNTPASGESYTANAATAEKSSSCKKVSSAALCLLASVGVSALLTQFLYPHGITGLVDKYTGGASNEVALNGTTIMGSTGIAGSSTGTGSSSIWTGGYHIRATIGEFTNDTIAIASLEDQSQNLMGWLWFKNVSNVAKVAYDIFYQGFQGANMRIEIFNSSCANLNVNSTQFNPTNNTYGVFGPSSEVGDKNKIFLSANASTLGLYDDQYFPLSYMQSENTNTVINRCAVIGRQKNNENTAIDPINYYVRGNFALANDLDRFMRRYIQV